MSKKAKKICLSISVIFALITLAEGIFMFFKPDRFKIYVPIAIVIAAVFICLICIYGLFKKKDFFFKIGLVGGFLGAIGVGVYLGMELSGITAILASESNLKEMIAKSGIWGPIVFIMIQFAQVTLVPIPSTVTILAGTMVFDLVEVLLYSTIGLVLGSVFAFGLGKIFGVKLVVWIVGEKAFNKYQKLIKGRDKTMLFMMFLLPVFPDDLLCLIAGITTMSYSTFFIMQIVARPIGVLLSAFGGELLKNVPFTGWYIAVWIGMGIGIIAMFILVWKYSGVIEEKLIKALSSKFSATTISTVDTELIRQNAKNLVATTSVMVENDIIDSYKPHRQVQTPKFTLNYRE